MFLADFGVLQVIERKIEILRQKDLKIRIF